MQKWLLSANSKVFSHSEAFNDNGFIDWIQNRNFIVGDIVFFYVTRPTAKIMFKTKVESVNLKKQDIVNQDKYWRINHVYDESDRFVRLSLLSVCDNDNLSYESLKKHGMKYPPQSPSHLKPELELYLEEFF